MTLDELTKTLVAKLGEKGKELAAQYGPTILAMARKDLQAWVDYVFVGRYADAYALYLRTLDPSGLFTEWDKQHVAWAAGNEANAAKIEMANRIGLAMVNTMLAVVLAVL